MSAQCAKAVSGTVITDDCITNAAVLPAGNLGQAYSVSLLAPALTAPMNWVLLNGTIPDGLTLNTSTGVISGTPTLESNYSFQIQVTDVNGLECLKNFTLSIGSASPSCGWWSGLPFVGSNQLGDAGATAVWTPTDLTGATTMTMDVHQPGNAAAQTFLDISGSQNFTGPITRLKFTVVITTATGTDPADGLRVLVSNGGVLLDQTLNTVGTHNLTVNIPNSASVNYLVALTTTLNPQVADSDFECTIRLACISITLSGEVGYFYDPTTNPLGQYQTTPGTPNPTATFTLVSPNPISVEMRARCVHTEGMTGESGTVDGVAIVWQDNNPPDQLMVTDPNPMQFDLDACVPKVIQINLTGNPGFNNTGQLYFVPV